MPNSRTPSASRVDRARRARQLRRLHEHLQNQTSPGNDEEDDHGDDYCMLLKQFTPDVLAQLDALTGGGDWKRLDNGEEEWDENWLHKSRSLATQLRHVQRWYENEINEVHHSPPQGEKPTATSSNQARPHREPPQTETADNRTPEAVMLQREMQQLERQDPDFFDSIEAYKATAVAGRMLSETRACHKQARDESLAKAMEMNRYKAEAQKAKRLALSTCAPATGRDEQVWARLREQREEARKAWQDARVEYLRAADKEKKAYKDVQRVLENFEDAEKAEQEAIRRWTMARN